MISVHVETHGMKGWRAKTDAAAMAAARKAGVSAVRKGRAAGSRAIRERKAMKVAHVNKAIDIVYPRDKQTLLWRVKASGAYVPVSAFPHRQTKGPGRDTSSGKFTKAKKVRGGRGGVYVTINKGQRVLIRGAFIATMKSGHTGVFKRRDKHKRLPIREAYTTTVADAFRDAIPRVVEVMRTEFSTTFARVLPHEVALRRGRA